MLDKYSSINYNYDWGKYIFLTVSLKCLMNKWADFISVHGGFVPFLGCCYSKGTITCSILNTLRIITIPVNISIFYNE